LGVSAGKRLSCVRSSLLAIYDIISECLNHDAFFVSKALIKILEHPVFKEQQFSRLTFWLDNGKHFKNKELLEMMFLGNEVTQFDVKTKLFFYSQVKMTEKQKNFFIFKSLTILFFRH
jgi:hypothetical protein